ncbi:erythromycin esterase family protein [Streptomyces sioyaensis]|uniref:erythromycin esterase family protein n=1 Tax=Streptomyces sioyaensis TaxID=67364 RepID=UPI0037AAD817
MGLGASRVPPPAYRPFRASRLRESPRARPTVFRNPQRKPAGCSDEFHGDYRWWNNTDHLRLIEWMRAYNVHHPHDPVQFMGDDIGWTGPEVYDAVTGYVARTHPELSARFDELYRGLRPTQYPRTQGAFLRDSLGPAYVNVGLTFDQGSFNATGSDGVIRRRTFGPAGPGSNERTLDRVRYRNYAVDLRTVGSPARAWLAAARPTRSIGTAYPAGPYDIALGRSYDILIHLHHIAAARLRDHA